MAVHNASLELAVSSGLDDYATGAKLTPDHRVPMGSTTKLYTAVAVLRLAEQGALSLDEPVAPLLDRYLALPRDCGQSGAFCEQSCLPHAHCFFDPSGTGCAGLPAGLGDACLGYCGRYIGCAGGGPVTARLLWQNQTDIEKVTFRQARATHAPLRPCCHFNLCAEPALAAHACKAWRPVTRH